MQAEWEAENKEGKPVLEKNNEEKEENEALPDVSYSKNSQLEKQA